MGIADLPIFRELVPTECQRLADLARGRHLTAGERMASDQGQGLFFVLTGELATSRDGPSCGIVDAPAVVGLLDLLEGRPTGESLVARVATDLLVIDRAVFLQMLGENPAIAGAVARHLAQDLRKLHSEVRNRLLGGTNDFFASPGACLPAGPYTTRADALVFVVKAAATRRWMPKGIRPIPGFSDAFLVMFSFFDRVSAEADDGRPLSLVCTSASVLSPCLGPRLRPSLFCLESYADNLTAVAVAREVYGLPERYGRTSRGDRCVDLFVGDRLVARASWRGVREVDIASLVPKGLPGVAQAGPVASMISAFASRWLGISKKLRTQTKPWPRLPLLVSKCTPPQDGPVAGAVVEVPLRVSELTNFAGLSGAKIEWFWPEYFARGDCVAAFSFRQSIDFGRGAPEVADKV